MSIEHDGPAPYAPISAVIEFLNVHRKRGLRDPATLDLLLSLGITESLAPRTLQALKLLDFIDDEGHHSVALTELRKTSEDDYQPRLEEHLRAVYQDVFQLRDPAEDNDAAKIRDAFRSYTPTGMQERMVTLFLGLCEHAGIIEKAKRGRGVATGASRSRKVATGRFTGARPAGKREQRGAHGHSVTDQTDTVEFTRSPAPATGQHPFIRGLIETLPGVGEPWAMADREKWTRAAMATFDLMYELPPEDRKGGEQP